MTDQEAAQEVGVELVGGRHRVDDRVGCAEPEHDRHVPELQVGVDQRHRPG
jgi:hypothetical protein